MLNFSNRAEDSSSVNISRSVYLLIEARLLDLLDVLDQRSHK